MPLDQPTDFRAQERAENFKRAYVYIFTHGDDLIHLARFDQNITVNGLPAAKGSDPQVFAAAQVTHGGNEEGIELDAAEMTVQLGINASPESNALRRYFLEAQVKPLRVEIIRINATALPVVDWTDDCFTVFVGECGAVGFGDYDLTLHFKSLSGDDSIPVPRFTWQKTCQHVLGKQGAGFCQANLEVAAHRIITTVASVNRSRRSIDIADTLINGNAITAKTFELGKVHELDGPGGAVVNKIGVATAEVLPASAGTRLRLVWLPPTLLAGVNIKVYRGCNRTTADCLNVFGNLANFGGMPYIPTANPVIHGIPET